MLVASVKAPRILGALLVCTMCESFVSHILHPLARGVERLPPEKVSVAICLR